MDIIHVDKMVAVFFAPIFILLSSILSLQNQAETEPSSAGEQLARDRFGG